MDTINKANEIFKNVKQTSDATLDSRLLVTAGDLSARRAIQNKLGGATLGIDVDAFVSKCVAFMRRGPSEMEADLITSTQSLRRRRGGNIEDSSDEENGDEGSPMNWEWLGRKICFPHNIRPPVPGFLLGPLSVQKRMRKLTQRTQRLQRRDPADAVRPDELKIQDIEKAENANLTMLCRKIYVLLYNTQVNGQRDAAIEFEQIGGDDAPEEEKQRILDKYCICDNGAVCLYRFAFNPHSFGQTVENLFYISFLIRDGKAGLGSNTQGTTTVRKSPPQRNTYK